MGNNCICTSIPTLPNQPPTEINKTNVDIAPSVSPSNSKRRQCKLLKYLSSTINKYTQSSEQRQRRVIFVSLIGLFKTWREVPFKIMSPAIFMIPLRREWIYNPLEHLQELGSCFISHLTLFSDVTETETFVKLLKWKDAQGLVVWMLDDHDECLPKNHNELVHGFWYGFSAMLTKLKDPITRTKYKPLQLDHLWWMNRDKYSTQYDVKQSSILTELFFFTMKYRTMQEIIYQSNPDSLLPVVSYGRLDKAMAMTTAAEIRTMYETEWSYSLAESEIDDHGVWYISEDYDPNEI
eukprot:41563_1